MGEKEILLDADLKAIDDDRTLDEIYFVRMKKKPDGSRVMVFDSEHTFSKSMTTIEKISALAEVCAFLARRLNRAEQINKAQKNKIANFEARITALETP